MEKRRLGITSGLAAYTLWGLLGVFWELLSVVPALDTLAYRIVFSLLTICIVLTVQRDWKTIWWTTKQLIKNRKIFWIILSSYLISINWFIYIYMVTHHEATEASLGYYIMPLMNVVIALMFLHEKLSRSKAIALLLVIVGVVILTIQTGSLPLNTLLMAASFCLYGLIKKQVQLPATISLTLETIFVAPVAIVYLLISPHVMTQDGLGVTTLLIFSGIITVIPLLLFAVATKNTDFITLGFIQYLNPTIQLLMAIFVMNESFSWHKAVVFVFIWLGILVFILGNMHGLQRVKRTK
ncbi:EamA family transporter RarD [Liquorilactobacillus mali]|uniref:RarD protein n=1 Tax=Liquorilactobacillus mali KCTC 3596 = DSM 20444 TaxID=1046596 RepID=J0L312_9LACO|nr:EamA family transporter RarD [Liquorilactobacillus mali]EJE97318.1 rarD protein [Liquorilactobacillus mali KCTC 3596 = DSM 20444]KRN11354.1 rarD protein [Liquorilactobacillus mali KCTC 3596 = DSM 20444]MDC7953141.1 EamA family transporter RarD [Liquorilactobacillus mali]MDV7757266.1 EamA family transporter RarD [Liquorilactobacillus mali]QFQ75312.1 EamA family transporter RarD [Liquorilactobacillus mali]